MSSRNQVKPIICILLALAIQASTPRMPAQTTETSQTSEKTPILADAPVEKYQLDLLELAFRVASKIPLNPHIKDRSRTQFSVVETALALEQPQLAEIYISQIADWRRPFGFANLAYYAAERKNKREAEKYLRMASPLSDQEEDWRRDRIRSKIAETYAMIGNQDRAVENEANVIDAERGRVATTNAKVGPKDDFEYHVKTLDALTSGGSFDLTRNAIAGWAAIFDRYYDQPERRQLALDRITSATKSFPGFLRIDYMVNLADSARKNNDLAGARQILKKALEIKAGYTWDVESGVPVSARIAKAFAEAGQREEAKSQADQAWAFYNEKKDTLDKIFRAEALAPLAEAYVVLGDKETALKIYDVGLVEGTANPNSRPRAESLVLLANSMARAKLNPNDELWKNLREVDSNLHTPW